MVSASAASTAGAGVGPLASTAALVVGGDARSCGVRVRPLTFSPVALATATALATSLLWVCGWCALAIVSENRTEQPSQQRPHAVHERHFFGGVSGWHTPCENSMTSTHLHVEVVCLLLQLAP